ncbi:NACHT domain-containing protein [Streptomyces sporangiiformans]|uniref:NACHT domain-containing protein n=1 Tax=Streptomyces sporangiiformans TaxID=2315329 RepID=A0A505DAR2_9ACTN|nr:NACHT domain-containing protein [Streptomyces sporangiiformans]TPQ20814.1 NACHT domain-containing protein [Streptomyces sporangiiformans]
MEPVVRIPSPLAAPLVQRLFRTTPRQLPAVPELIAAFTTWRGPEAPAHPDEVHRTAAEFIQLAAETHTTPTAELPAVVDVLACTLLAIGELDLTDVEAVRLGPQDYARRLRGAVQGADRDLSPDAAWFHDALLVNICLHVLHHFIRRSPHIQRHLPERSSRIRQLVDLNDTEAAALQPERSQQDADFEAAYVEEIVRQHGWLTIVGVDFPNAPDRWLLEDTYLSLEAEESSGRGDTAEQRTVLLADRALEGHERVLLRGVAGSGKTTLVQWLAVAAAREGARVPFVLPVRRFAREGFPAPDDFLHAIRHPLADRAPEGWVVRTLLAGRALLLVDGIDEAPEETRGKLRDQLRRLLRIFSGNGCLVTSRPSAVADGWLTDERLSDEGFVELSLAPMSRDQVTRFIRDWHSAAMSDEHCREQRDRDELKEYEQRLLHSVRISRELRQLATNPLMCGLICALNRDRSGSLPQGRKELYEAALEMLLQRRDPERDVLYADDVRLQQEPRERLLQKLAHAMVEDGVSELPCRRAVAILDGALPAIPAARAAGDGEKIFRHLLHRTGLLREQAGLSVDFIHRTFQDYLAAKEIVARGRLRTLVDHAHQPEWEEVIRMAAAQARPDECGDFLELLLSAAPRLRRPQVNHRRLMAAACLDHVTELDPSVQRLVHDRTKNLVRPTTELAARGLGWVGPIVLELLPDPEQVPDDQQALLLAITATRVQDDAAIDYLSRLRRRSSLAIRTELARPWRHFDTERYAREIIAHLDPDGLYFPVSDTAELAALRDLGGRPRVQLAGIMPNAELMDGLDHTQLTHLWLNAEPTDPDMSWLSRFPHLRVLRVNPRLPRVRNVPEGVRITA